MNYYKENEKDRTIRRLKRESDLGFTFNSILMIIIMVIFVFSVLKIASLNNKLYLKENKIKQYQMYIDDVINTDEFRAVQKCRDGAGERWMAECIACELDMRKENAKNVR